MTDPVASGGVDDLLLEEDLEDDAVVDTPSARVSYLAAASSSDKDAAPGNASRGVPTRVPTTVPSGGLMQVCSGSTVPTVGGQPRVAEPLPPPPAARPGTSAGAGAGFSRWPCGRRWWCRTRCRRGQLPCRHGGSRWSESPAGRRTGDDGGGRTPQVRGYSTWAAGQSSHRGGAPCGRDATRSTAGVERKIRALPMVVDGGSYSRRVPAFFPPQPRGRCRCKCRSGSRGRRRFFLGRPGLPRWVAA